MKNKILRKDDILGGTLKENLRRITESYNSRNGIREYEDSEEQTISEAEQFPPLKAEIPSGDIPKLIARIRKDFSWATEDMSDKEIYKYLKNNPFKEWGSWKSLATFLAASEMYFND